jgi:hypothetical protein
MERARRLPEEPPLPPTPCKGRSWPPRSIGSWTPPFAAFPLDFTWSEGGRSTNATQTPLAALRNGLPTTDIAFLGEDGLRQNESHGPKTPPWDGDEWDAWDEFVLAPNDLAIRLILCHKKRDFWCKDANGPLLYTRSCRINDSAAVRRRRSVMWTTRRSGGNLGSCRRDIHYRQDRCLRIFGG